MKFKCVINMIRMQNKNKYFPFCFIYSFFLWSMEMLSAQIGIANHLLKVYASTWSAPVKFIIPLNEIIVSKTQQTVSKVSIILFIDLPQILSLATKWAKLNAATFSQRAAKLASSLQLRNTHTQGDTSVTIKGQTSLEFYLMKILL